MDHADATGGTTGWDRLLALTEEAARASTSDRLPTQSQQPSSLPSLHDGISLQSDVPPLWNLANQVVYEQQVARVQRQARLPLGQHNTNAPQPLHDPKQLVHHAVPSDVRFRYEHQPIAYDLRETAQPPSGGHNTSGELCDPSPFPSDAYSEPQQFYNTLNEDFSFLSSMDFPLDSSQPLDCPATLYGLKRPRSPSREPQVPPPKRAEVDIDLTATPDPPRAKRRPGRPKGTKKKDKAATTLTPAASAPTPPTSASPAVAADGDATVKTGTTFAVEELDKIFHFLLDSDDRFELYQVQSNDCWKKWAVNEELVLPGRSASAIKGAFERNYVIFRRMLAIKTFTGNGPDADTSPDWDSITDVSERIEDCKKAGYDSTGVTAKEFIWWQTSGWFKLFADRFQDNPKTQREVARSSADPVTDDETSDDGGVGIPSTPAIDHKSKRKTTAPKSSSKPTPSRSTKKEGAGIVVMMGEIMESRLKQDRRLLELKERELERKAEERKEKRDAEEYKRATELVGNPDIDEETKAPAREFIREYWRAKTGKAA